MRRRISSLYLPLVFWNALFLGMLLVWFSQQPGHAIFKAINIDFGNAGWLDYLNAAFAVTERPIGFQFWFIRDLFVTVLVSPLLWLALRRAPHFGMAVLGTVWLMGSGMLIFFRPDVVFFFYLGGFLRMYKAPLDIGLRATLVFFALYVGLIALRALAPMFLEFSHPRPELLTLATRLSRLVGVLACWGVLLQLSPTRLGAALARYGGLTFFLYAAHFPLLAGVKILLWRWVPSETDGWMLAHYISSVTVTVAIALSVALLLARVMPNWFALMNGGRLALGESRRISPVGASGLVGTRSPVERYDSAG
jgi:peptidoglycan/LPS O-acetylase OafA/YrhL